MNGVSSAGLARAILLRGRQGGVRRRRATTAGRGAKPPSGSEASDEPLDALVVGLERILAEDRLALRVVELQVDPVHAVVLALQVCLADELAAQARARGLRRG